uniref:Bifunctional inhibitor/plant lipid transfer protein/seed storage helical domain-containing protein n=1 Tax=Oryza meridionalis TaxID=40149 RepID=A0A0E0F0T6_9ORYZ
MAVAHKNSSRSKLAVAAIVALMSLLVFAAAPSEACSGGCNGRACRSRCAKPTPAPARRAAGAKCPFDALKLAVCADVLGGGGGGGLLNLDHLLGSSSPSSSGEQCCGLLAGLADVDAAVCLCTALRANVLGPVRVKLPVQLSVLVNRCSRKLPNGFQCSSN